MTVSDNALMGRRDYAIVALLWAALSTAFVFMHRDAIATMTLPDADDYLRLQQVRDWLAGQNWFDVTQHRVNPPTGGVLHWTRLVDLPIAAAILALRPFIGQPAAEMITATLLPLLLMGVCMLLVAGVTARLVGRSWAPIAVLCIPLSGIVYPQILPLRIDHHAWQLICALALFAALTNETRKRQGGVIAGLAAAFWLDISLEGLPIVTVAALILGVRWLFDARELDRLRSYLWALTLGSFALETLFAPSAWSIVECDRVSQPYFAAFATASVAMLAAGWRKLQPDWRARLAFGATAGLCAAAAFAAIGPHCLAGPFANIDPLTRSLWLDKVGESLPLIERGAGAFIAYAGFSAAACVGALLAIRETRGETRFQWITAFTLTFAAALMMILVTRTGAVAHAFAAVGAAYLGMRTLSGARKLKLMPARILGTVLALTVATPVLLLPALKLDAKTGSTRRACGTAYDALTALPPGTLFAPIDIGPRMIARTSHSVIATGHHRNHLAMRDVIAAFTSNPADAYRLITAHDAQYVVLCSEAPEIRNYVRLAPAGLAAQLVSGNAPPWLHPLDIAPPGSRLLVFSVDASAHPEDSLRGRLVLSATDFHAN